MPIAKLGTTARPLEILNEFLNPDSLGYDAALQWLALCICARTISLSGVVKKHG